MNQTLRVLQVEDSESDAELILRSLRSAGYEALSTRVEDADGMRAALGREDWDVVIADHRMAQFDAPGALRVLHEAGQDIPFIVVSGSIGEELAVTMMKSGAHDYVLKRNLARLAPAVDREVREARLRRERRQADRDLRESQERLALAAKATRLGTFDYSPQTGEVVLSASAKRHFGLPPQAGVSYDTFLQGIHPEDRERTENVIRNLLLSGRDSQYSNEYRTIGIQDGELRWISSWGSIFFDPHGRPVRLIGVTLDVTETKKLEEEYRRAQQRLRHIVASSPAVLFTLATDGNQIQGISWTSDNLRDMLGYPPEAAIGEHWWKEGIHPDDCEAAMAAAHDELFTRGYSTLEYRFRHADGIYRWTRCEIRLIRDEAVGAWSDITERKRAEEEQARLREQLQHAQKLESIGRLAGGVAHDFNNLLTVINGYCDMLLNSLTPQDPMHESVTEIKIAGERAAALSRQLLVLSRKNVVQPKHVNLNDVVAEVEKMLGRVIGEDIRLESVMSPFLGSVLADPGQLHQVLMNLAVNSRDAMPGGGTVRIETANVELEAPRAQSLCGVKPGRYVQLKVSDTGVGMTPDVLSHVFEPFFTTKAQGEGTGLGLATVYGIVRQCGGSIQVVSEPGKGTEFTIYLPWIDAAGAGEECATAPGVSSGTETILVVEDQEQLRTVIGRVLREHGYQVLEAAGPAEAVSDFERYPGAIHLMLTDIVMPGMTGLELAGRFQPARPAMKVIFMSGYAGHAIADLSLDGSRAFIAKPFSTRELAAKVRAVLGPPCAAGTVLVVDDDPQIRSLLRKILAGAGYRILEARNGVDAVRQIETCPVDLMLTDLAMPEREGLETIQMLRRQRPQLKMVAMSGQFAGPMLKAAVKLGAQASLAKPIQPEELLQIVGRVMLG